ncbi:MAG: hypothetical protein KY476_12545 [Planctomycetes bacterium]|nr:hypothetical protein [Planctomycetota bacterium]
MPRRSDLEETIADIEESLRDEKAGRIRSFDDFDAEFRACHGIEDDELINPPALDPPLSTLDPP